jgi:hypothetical protein
VVAEPLDGVGEGLFGRGLGDAEFADGFGGVEEHFVFGHADAGKGGFGRFAGDAGSGFVNVSGHEGDGVGDLEFGGGQAGDFLENGEGLFHGPVAVGIAENIALAKAAFFGGKNVADGDVADMDPVEAGIEVGGHLAVEEIDDDLAGGGGLDVAGTDGGAGIDDDDGSTLGGKFAGDDFGAPLGNLVVIAHLRLGDGRGFVGGSDGAVGFLGQTDATDGAGIDDAGTAGLGGGLDDVTGALHVGGVHGGVVAEPEVVAGGDVKAPIAAAHGGGVGGRIGDIARDTLEIEALGTAEVTVGAQKCLDAMAASDQFVDKIGSDEARSAGDEAVHIERWRAMKIIQIVLVKGIKRSSSRGGNKNVFAELIWHEKSGQKLDLNAGL